MRYVESVADRGIMIIWQGSALKVKLSSEQTSGKDKSRLRSRSPGSIPRAVAASFF